MPTLLGDEYRVTPESVERHLEQIKEISAATFVATSRDQPRLVATADAAPILRIGESTIAATKSDTLRPVATDDDSSRYVAHLENENEFLRGQISVKDSQIETSNKQIAALTERVGESNKLLLGFQQLLGLRSTTKDEKAARPTADDHPSNV
jgi:ABC-type Fe3+/spermidine/putrescine transport system ATPase subunit